MAYQKNILLKVGQEGFSLIDQYHLRRHQRTEAGLIPLKGWLTPTGYPEYTHDVQFRNPAQSRTNNVQVDVNVTETQGQNWRNHPLIYTVKEPATIDCFGNRMNESPGFLKLQE
ncbi:hypothetical protein SLE2022_165420 [Rubroshorea leprosula]